MPPIENSTRAGTPLASQKASRHPMSRRSAGSAPSIRTLAACSDIRPGDGIRNRKRLAGLRAQQVAAGGLQVALDDFDRALAVPRRDGLDESAVLVVVSGDPRRHEHLVLDGDPV